MVPFLSLQGLIHRAFEFGNQGILIRHSGLYRIAFSASNSAFIVSNIPIGNPGQVVLTIDKTLTGPTLDIVNILSFLNDDPESIFEEKIEIASILQGTETMIDICVSDHDCSREGVLLQLITPTGILLGTFGHLTASVTIIRLREPICDCDE